jgi:hypothetical protein
MRVSTFARRYPTGRYVVHTHRHVAAVVDGVLCDAIESSRRLVTRA